MDWHLALAAMLYIIAAVMYFKDVGGAGWWLFAAMFSTPSHWG